MGIREKDRIEMEFGPLWTGLDTITVGERLFTMNEIKRAFDLWADDIVGIDLLVLPEEKYAFRFYDGDDRRVAVFVFDKELNITAEYRAHIADWLGDEYYGSGMKAFLPEAMVRMLHRKVTGAGDGAA